MVMVRPATAGLGILTPEEVGELVVRPIIAASTALQVCNVVPTDSGDFRIPIIADDAGAQWVAEAADIPLDDADVTEEIVRPTKVAGLTKVSSELAQDSSPAATQVVGESIARSIARQIDLAFFSNTTANGPDGLLSLGATQFVTAGSGFTNVDPFTEAASLVEGVGGNVTAWCTNASTALVLATLKEETGSNKPLLQPDPTQASRRLIGGAPLFVVPGAAGAAIGDGRVWGLDGSRVFAIMRRDVEVAIDASYFFNSDSFAVRSTARLGFGYPDERCVVRIGVGGS
ncbi:phage major capsid protein [Mycobacterium sp. B14F4]|uniref:phage major capsid protein n=1 Tax=Mycobacterium sp. B14F4 TaxID=3153565 RepID=UPI00325E501A